MTKIRSSNSTKGRPGGWGKPAVGQSGGGLVNKTRAGISSVRRLIAKDPANGNSALIGTSKDPGNLGTIKVATYASKSISPTGTSRDILYTAVDPGVAGNAITIAYVDPGANDQALAVVVASSAITVNLATGVVGAITSTPTTILAALAASTPASALVEAELDPADTTGDPDVAVAAVSATHLVGGADMVPVSDNSPNTQGASSPRVLSDAKSRRASVPAGQEKVVNRGTNRKVRRTRY